MFDTASASNGVKLALLEGQLLTREIDRATFIERAANLGLPAPVIGDAADKFVNVRDMFMWNQCFMSYLSLQFNKRAATYLKNSRRHTAARIA